MRAHRARPSFQLSHGKRSEKWEKHQWEKQDDSWKGRVKQEIGEWRLSDLMIGSVKSE